MVEKPEETSLWFDHISSSMLMSPLTPRRLSSLKSLRLSVTAPLTWILFTHHSKDFHCLKWLFVLLADSMWIGTCKNERFQVSSSRLDQSNAKTWPLEKNLVPGWFEFLNFKSIIKQKSECYIWCHRSLASNIQSIFSCVKMSLRFKQLKIK